MIIKLNMSFAINFVAFLDQRSTAWIPSPTYPFLPIFFYVKAHLTPFHWPYIHTKFKVIKTIKCQGSLHITIIIIIIIHNQGG